MMSLLSLALCVCDAEPIYGMLVWPRCEDAPPDTALLYRAAISHVVFDVCPAVSSAQTSSHLLLCAAGLSLSLCVCVSSENVRRWGVSPFVQAQVCVY